MTNIYILGSTKFIKQSMKGFDRSKYSISTTDNPELFKIQLSKENDPDSIILIDSNMIESSGFFDKILPFKSKKLDMEFIKEHPLLNDNINSFNVENYNEVNSVISKLNITSSNEINEDLNTSYDTIATEDEYSDAGFESEDSEEQEVDSNIEEEFDLEALLASGGEDLPINNDEDKEDEDDDDEEFDLEALIASELGKQSENSEPDINDNIAEPISEEEDDEEFDLEALIASETAKFSDTQATETTSESEESEEDISEISSADDAKVFEKEINEDEATTINEPSKLVEQSEFTENGDPRIMMPNECAFQINEIINQLLNGEIIDIHINISKAKNPDNKGSVVVHTNTTNYPGNIENLNSHNRNDASKFNYEEDLQAQISKIEAEFSDTKPSTTEGIVKNDSNESFDLEELIKEQVNPSSLAENTQDIQDNESILDSEEDSEGIDEKIKNRKIKTTAQNMMEHFSEDEIVQMVIDGKL